VSDPVNQLVCWCIEGVWGGGSSSQMMSRRPFTVSVILGLT
jgi:hypothetical protein